MGVSERDNAVRRADRLLIRHKHHRPRRIITESIMMLQQECSIDIRKPEGRIAFCSLQGLSVARPSLRFTRLHFPMHNFGLKSTSPTPKATGLTPGLVGPRCGWGSPGSAFAPPFSLSYWYRKTLAQYNKSITIARLTCVKWNSDCSHRHGTCRWIRSRCRWGWGKFSLRWPVVPAVALLGCPE